MRILAIFVLLFLALCLAFAASADVVYVDCNAPGPEHDGTSWDTAFLTIQEGVDAATPDGDVWVADGTYVENVVMGSGVAIYGGFLGAEEGGYEDSLDQRDYVNNVATIDGNQSGSCVVMAVDARVDGFTITNGSGTPAGDEHYGGGVYCRQLSDTGVIANNTIAANGLGVWCHGGGIYCEDSSPTIADCVISGNSALSGRGGGIYCYRASPSVIRNTIRENAADNDGGEFGGGICCWQGSAPAVEGSIISDNRAYWGAGICCRESSSAALADNVICGNSGSCGAGVSWGDMCSPALIGNVISDNWAYWEGGGVHCYGPSSAVVMDNTFSGNYGGGMGGGMFCQEASTTVSGNTFSGNTVRSYGGAMYLTQSSDLVAANMLVENSAQSGGGIYCHGRHGAPVVVGNEITTNSATRCGGGATCAYCDPETVVAGNVLHNNKAEDGGGICCDSGSPMIACNTIARNAAEHWGGGICCYSGSDPMITNSIIWENEAASGSEIFILFKWATVRYCDVKGGWGGEGNIDADPMFVDPENGDFHLTSESPCIDAGCNDYVVTDEDIDGDPRIIWAMRFPVPYWPHPGYVDMGADEFVPGLTLRRLRQWGGAFDPGR